MTSFIIAGEIAAAAFAALAAVLWHMSAVVKLPDLVDNYAANSRNAGTAKAGDSSRLVTDDLYELTCALRLQSQYSKWAGLLRRARRGASGSSDRVADVKGARPCFLIPFAPPPRDRCASDASKKSIDAIIHGRIERTLSK